MRAWLLRAKIGWRLAAIHNQRREKFDEGTYTPLQNVAEGQALFVVIDSNLLSMVPVRQRQTSRSLSMAAQG